MFRIQKILLLIGFFAVFISYVFGAENITQSSNYLVALFLDAKDNLHIRFSQPFKLKSLMNRQDIASVPLDRYPNCQVVKTLSQYNFSSISKFALEVHGLNPQFTTDDTITFENLSNVFIANTMENFEGIYLNSLGAFAAVENSALHFQCDQKFNEILIKLRNLDESFTFYSQYVAKTQNFGQFQHESMLFQLEQNGFVFETEIKDFNDVKSIQYVELKSFHDRISGQPLMISVKMGFRAPKILRSLFKLDRLHIPSYNENVNPQTQTVISTTANSYNSPKAPTSKHNRLLQSTSVKFNFNPSKITKNPGKNSEGVKQKETVKNQNPEQVNRFELVHHVPNMQVQNTNHSGDKYEPMELE